MWRVVLGEKSSLRSHANNSRTTTSRAWLAARAAVIVLIPVSSAATQWDQAGSDKNAARALAAAGGKQIFHG
jgi:hypothetical protein